MKIRTLYEGPQWDDTRKKVTADAARFDEQFRFIAWNISTKPRVNTTAFLTDDHRILETRSFPTAPKLWIYFRIAADDDSCLLHWITYPKVL